MIEFVLSKVYDEESTAQELAEWVKEVTSRTSDLGCSYPKAYFTDNTCGLLFKEKYKRFKAVLEEFSLVVYYKKHGIMFLTNK